MKSTIYRTASLKHNYRSIFSALALIFIFYFSLQQSYLLFHSVIELFSIVIAFAVFIVTWNSRRMMDNNYLYLVGISYLFIGALDLLHTLTFKGMNVIPEKFFYANQFWVATRFMEAVTLVIGFSFLKRTKALNADLIFLSYFFISLLITLSILDWHIFPICFIEGMGQTPFKIYAEYVIIAILLLAGYLLYYHRRCFSQSVYILLFSSLIFTILSEFCFTLYASNYSASNEYGHYFKLIAFFLIYKANVETGFSEPTGLIFKNLKDNEEKYRTLTENLPGLIMRFDYKLTNIYANSTATELMFHENLPPALRQILELVREEGQHKQMDIEIETERQRLFFAVQVIPEFYTDANHSTFLIICQDITPMKMAGEQLSQLNATKDKLFSVIAHDLKNPFTSILSFSELISRNAGKLSMDKVQHMAMRMNDSAKQAYSLLENLLNWSRVQTGILSANRQILKSLDLLDEAMLVTEVMAQTKDIVIQIELSGDMEVYTDRQMTNTILRNLLSNAIKFSYPNSIITIKAEDKLDHIQFSVADTGVGIENVNKVDLLKIESKLSTPGTAAEKGTGLGLMLCKDFVELCGGKIWFESEYGIGTIFYFTLPKPGYPE